MEWTEELITQLRGLWDEGRSTAEIGRHIGMSKNAVVGKAHRLNLPPRPSPIRRESGLQPAHPRTTAVRGPTLPPLGPPAGAVRTERNGAQPAPRPQTLLNIPPTPPDAPAAVTHDAAPPSPLVAAVGPAPRGREVACCWPLGDPGTRGFHFCGAAASAGKPYCAQHAQLAYVRVRDRREDAA
ncbi:MAG: GcrA family cell cycle regulator [Acetobacteraceae bacterium]